MADAEKVISDLEKLCNGKSSNVPFVCYNALELLKEQQAEIKRLKEENAEIKRLKEEKDQAIDDFRKELFFD